MLSIFLAPVFAFCLFGDGQDCEPVGAPLLGTYAGVQGFFVSDLESFDDGSGPAIFMAGGFAGAGGVASNDLAKWNGSAFVDLPSPPIDSPRTMIVHDDGSGLALYVGGRTACARWDGSTWTTLAALNFSTEIEAFATYDDGNGPALYMAGRFGGSLPGVTAGQNLAKWDGSSWSDVGGPLSSSLVTDKIEALAVYDDGQGPRLFVGGPNMAVNGVGFKLGAWDGQQWSAISAGFGSRDIQNLATFDDGSGLKLAVSTRPDNSDSNQIFSWDGTELSALGSELIGPLLSLTFVDLGDGPALYSSQQGPLQNQPGTLVRWNGSSWAPVPDAPNDVVLDLLRTEEQGQPVVYCGGSFTAFPGLGVGHIARLDSQGWSALGEGLAAEVACSVRFDDGTGEALYLGGLTLGTNAFPAENVARWDGSNLTSVGNKFSDFAVSSLAAFDASSGPALYAGLEIPFLSDPLAQRPLIYRWDPQGSGDWVVVGNLLGEENQKVRDMLVFDDGNGPALWCAIGGSTPFSGPIEFLQKWDGATWTSFSISEDSAQSSIRELEVYDSGFGPELIVAGAFRKIEGVSAARIARWNGTEWSPLGAGFLGSNVTVQGLAVYDRFLYAGGNIGGKLQRWDGVAWEQVPNPGPGNSQALYVFDGGLGETLFAGGAFGVKSWDGTAWSEISNNPDGAVDNMQSFQDKLFFGGRFESTLETGDSYFSSWGKPCDGPLPYCEAGVSTSGCSAIAGSSDPLAQPVSGANDYSVTASGVESFKVGIVFAGITGPAQLPFVSGTLCVQPPLARGPLSSSFGNGLFTCTGSFSTVVNDGQIMVPMGLDGGPGSSVWYQWWHRDPGMSGNATLSNGIRLDFQ